MKFVTVTAGHSNADPGAVNGKRTEAEIVTEMRNMVVHYLNETGIVTRTDGTGKTNLSLNEAIKLTAGATVSIEFHCNAAASTKATGIEVLSDSSKKGLAQSIAAAIHGVMGIPLRGDKGWKSESSGQHSRLGFISKGQGLIVELFFISNKEDLAIWDDKKWLIAKAVAGAIKQYVDNRSS